MTDQLDRIEEKLDRLLDPEHGVHAKLAEHVSDDAVKHRTLFIAIAVLASAAAGGPAIAHAVVKLLE